MGDVKLLSRWDGWCDPCGIERPLLLTAKGEFGPRAWLSGVGMEDRTLVLTCGVCGEWQLCPWDEEFPAETVSYVEAGPAAVQSTESEVVTKRGMFSRRKPEVVEPVEAPAEATVVELPPVTAVEEQVEVGTPSRSRFFGRRQADAEVVEVVAVAEVVPAEPVEAVEETAPARTRIEAEIPEIVDAELLRSIARAAARAEAIAAAIAAAPTVADVVTEAEPAADEPPAAKRGRFGRKPAPIVEAVEEAPVAAAPPARPKRKTAPVQHIVLQTAYGPARPTAVPALPAPRSATQDDALHLLAEGLDLITSAGR